MAMGKSDDGNDDGNGDALSASNVHFVCLFVCSALLQRVRVMHNHGFHIICPT